MNLTPDQRGCLSWPLPSKCRADQTGLQGSYKVIINEKQLAERAAKGDPEAFANLYNRYVGRIYKYVYYGSGRSEDAEDLTARVFLKAWEAIDHYRWEGYPFSTWLYRIAHNQVIDYYRTRHETFSLELAYARAGDDDPVEALEQHLTVDRVHAALAHLTEEQRRVIVLRFLLGYSSQEVADILDKNSGAIRALQVRALRALQPWLGDEGRPAPNGRTSAAITASWHEGHT